MSYEALNLQDEEAQTEVPQAKTNSSVSWLVRGVSAGLVCATVAAIVLLKFASPVSSGNVLGAKELFAASISACAAGTMHQCPESWKDPSQIMGYHCLHKLTRQASEAAYQSSGGACRPASDGPFPEADCQAGRGSKVFSHGWRLWKLRRIGLQRLWKLRRIWQLAPFWLFWIWLWPFWLVWIWQLAPFWLLWIWLRPFLWIQLLLWIWPSWRRFQLLDTLKLPPCHCRRRRELLGTIKL
ncbi:unnamed protein product [Durusdinium trenchii]|uniref:Uncharacterized protein n=1 Tax=Durusdinium trenchii TaxID=1381693 RepID=A0ABP0R034_9DINO